MGQYLHYVKPGMGQYLHYVKPGIVNIIYIVIVIYLKCVIFVYTNVLVFKGQIGLYICVYYGRRCIPFDGKVYI
jgi:hypothetical protein